MRSFKFSLESVLYYREMLEDNQKHLLAKAFHKQDQERTKLEQCQQFYRDIKGHLPEGLLDIKLWQYRDMLADLVWQEIEQQRQVVDQATEEVINCQERVKKAMCERKLLEKLKEKQARKFRYETNCQELFAADELALIAHNYEGKE